MREGLVSTGNILNTPQLPKGRPESPKALEGMALAE
jgi:hypothetical protein